MYPALASEDPWRYASEDLLESCVSSLSMCLSAHGLRWNREIIVHIASQLMLLSDGDAETTLARKAEQRGLLEMIGFQPVEARSVRRRMPLPGNTRPSGSVILPSVYHPVRMQEVLTHFSKTMTEDGTNQDATHHVDRMRNRIIRSDDIPLLPWDREIARTGIPRSLADEVDAIATGCGTILDAEGWLWQPHEVRENPSFLPQDVAIPAYVHFGCDAFPSPYPGMGVEGCYVAVENPFTGSAILVLHPVLSMPRHRMEGPFAVHDGDPVRAFLDHVRSVQVRYDIRLSQIPENEPVPGLIPQSDRSTAWEAFLPAIRDAVVGAIAAQRYEIVRPVTIRQNAGGEKADVRILGPAATSAQYPDDGGGFPLGTAYWPETRLDLWLTAFREIHESASASLSDLAAVPHGWIDRGIRLVQESVPNRDQMPDLKERPNTRVTLIAFLSAFPPESATMMPTWQALRWLMRISPLHGQIRLHTLLEQSLTDPRLDIIVHVLRREMPKDQPVRKAWADLVQAVADAKTYPDAESLIPGLMAHAYLADAALAERLLEWRGTPTQDEDLMILSVHARTIQHVAQRLPTVMTLLRTRGATLH